MTAEIAADVLAECPDDDWRLVFALARYGGMRCPSEILTLRWSDVLWDQKKLRIDSPKTGFRFCPIFPELAPILEAAFDAAPEGATFCVQRYRQGYNPATTMKKIIERAGHEPWPKLFINCRSTRRTKLERQFPNHVVNKWLGHSAAVAARTRTRPDKAGTYASSSEVTPHLQQLGRQMNAEHQRNKSDNVDAPLSFCLFCYFSSLRTKNRPPRLLPES